MALALHCLPVTYINMPLTAQYANFSSLQNHCVERIWVEINARVNYPIKNCLVALQASGSIDMDCPHEKFCVSWFTIRVASIGIALAVDAWNDHTIPGK